MIKVLYDNSGKITEYWAIDEKPQVPYIEITEDIFNQIKDKDYFIIKDGSLTDLSQTDEYKSKKEQEQKEQQNNDVKKQILEIETKQNRAIRESLIYNDETSKAKIKEFETQIKTLRTQLSTPTSA